MQFSLESVRKTLSLVKISLRNSSRILLANLLPPTISQGANQRTYNVIFLSRDGFSDRIIFLCCKNIYSSLLFIVLFTAIRHFPIYFTLLCNFSWQLISLFDSWPVMPSLFFEMFVCFFPTRRYEHRLSEMHKAYQSFFFQKVSSNRAILFPLHPLVIFSYWFPSTPWK